jgi:6-pyruvoyltetrahydropterin/6-carboxytetrahydropterin synthase
MMYTVAVRQDLVAYHYLWGGDWGAENERHAHHYGVEVQAEGKTLDKHGYLLDIADLEVHLEEVLAYFREQTLNELPEFVGLNPSVEHFARIICQDLMGRIKAPLRALRVRIWETESIWAAYRQER